MDDSLPIQFLKIQMKNSQNQQTNLFEFSENGKLYFEIRKKVDFEDFCIMNLTFLDHIGNELFVISSNDLQKSPIQQISANKFSVEIDLPKELLKPGIYHVTPSLYLYGKGSVDVKYNLIKIEIIDTHSYRGLSGRFQASSMIAPLAAWDFQELS